MDCPTYNQKVVDFTLTYITKKRILLDLLEATYMRVRAAPNPTFHNSIWKMEIWKQDM